MKTLVRLDALSKIFVLVIFHFLSSLWCSDLAISCSALQCKIINSIKGHYFAWKTDGWKNNEQQNRCLQVPIQRLYSDTWCDNRNVIYLPFYAVIEWFHLKFRHAHLFKKKHKMRLLDLQLDYNKGDQRFTLKMYYILLSFVDCAPRPYHGGFALLLVPKIMWKAWTWYCINMRLLNSYRACKIMHVHPFFPYWPFDRSCGFMSVELSLN